MSVLPDRAVMVDLHAMFKILSRRKIQLLPREVKKKLTKLLTRMIHVGPTIVVKIGLMQALPAILNIGVQMLMTHYVHLA
jgi:hypothetical protein